MLAPDEVAQIKVAWSRQWPAHLPLGYEVRATDPARWLRLHFAREPRGDRTEVARAGAVGLVGELLDAVASTDGDRESELNAIVVGATSEWDGSSRQAVTLPDQLRRGLTEYDVVHPDEELTYDLLCGRFPIHSPELALLIGSVVDGVLWSVVFTPPDCRFLVAPYQDGVDVVASTVTARHALARQFANSLSRHPRGL